MMLLCETYLVVDVFGFGCYHLNAGCYHLNQHAERQADRQKTTRQAVTANNGQQ